MVLTLRVLLPFAFGYLVSCFLRVINAVAAEPIAADIALGPGALGFLTSVFFFGFALSQIPLGILMDRYGPRRTAGATMILLAAGTAMFALAGSFSELVVGRFLMGVGASLALMAPFTAFRVWFDARQLPLVTGAHLCFGALGTALGGLPTEWMIAAYGWRAVFVLLAIAVLASAVAIVILVPARREPTGRPQIVLLSRQLGTIFTARAFWRIAPLSATSQGAHLSISTLWTGPWLREVAGLDQAAAATWLSVYALALIVGFLGTGIMMNRARDASAAERVVIAALLAFVVAQVALIVLPPTLGTVVWLAYNVIGAAGALTYTMLVAYFPAAMAGRANTALNFVVFVTAFAMQWLFGVLLDFFPDGAGGTSPVGYATGFWILIGLQVVALGVWVAVKPGPPVAAEARPETA